MNTKRKAGELPTGWCMTGYHDECTNFYLKQKYARICPCSCHPVDKAVADEVESEDE